jgi:hypothetical protein
MKTTSVRLHARKTKRGISSVRQHTRMQQEKLQNTYAKLCGYDYPPFTWKPTDYTVKGWKKLINQAKKDKKKRTKW